jgi:hypothetical protein
VDVPIQQSFGGLHEDDLNTDTAKSALRIAIANVTNVGLGDVEITDVSNYYEMRRRLIPGDLLGVNVNYTVSIVVGELVDDDGVGAADAAITSITDTIVAASTPANVGDASPLMGALVSAFEQVFDDDSAADSMITTMRSATVEVPIVNTVAINVDVTSSAPTSRPSSQPSSRPSSRPSSQPSSRPSDGNDEEEAAAFPIVFVVVPVILIGAGGFGYHMMSKNKDNKYQSKIAVGESLEA